MSITKPKNFGPDRERLHEIIFEADTAKGKWFDIILLIMIFGSVLAVALETVPRLDTEWHHNFFWWLEFGFTLFFTAEYFLRIYSVHSPKRYIFSFFGIIDLLAILPFFLAYFLVNTKYLVIIRSLRLLRVFRIFKLVSFIKGASEISRALRASRAKIFVFLTFVLILVTILGSLVFLIETDTNPQFRSIPQSVYWAIVTLTTVGYGDIAPITPFGQFIAACIMITGYAVIAVPTGIVSAEMVNPGVKANQEEISLNTQACKNCSKEGHDDDAECCKYCGADLY